MYRQFQHDLYRLRLEAARAYAGILEKGLSPISVSSEEPVKLHVEVSLFGLMVYLWSECVLLILECVLVHKVHRLCFRIRYKLVDQPIPAVLMSTLKGQC